MIETTKIPTFYINLDEREDRKIKVEELLKKLEFENFERFPATKAEGRSIGCSTSHANVLRHIVKNNIYPALILEDDIEVFEFKNTIKSPEDADAMYLGFSRYGFNHDPKEPHPRSLKITELGEEYHRAYNMLARHAIVHLSPEYDLACIDMMDKFFDDPEKYVAGDASIAKIHPDHKVYVQNTPLFYQDDPKTRTLTKHSIYDCEYVEMDKL
jgi:hypothetical protein